MSISISTKYYRVASTIRIRISLLVNLLEYFIAISGTLTAILIWAFTI